MDHLILRAVAASGDMTPTQHYTLIVLATLVDDKGIVRDKHLDEVAEHCKCNRRTLTRSFNRLHEMGLIEIHKQFTHGNGGLPSFVVFPESNDGQ